MALRYMIHQSLAADAPAMQPHHLDIGGCLIDEHEPGSVKHALFSHPAPSRPRHDKPLPQKLNTTTLSATISHLVQLTACGFF